MSELKVLNENVPINYDELEKNRKTSILKEDESKKKNKKSDTKSCKK